MTVSKAFFVGLSLAALFFAIASVAPPLRIGFEACNQCFYLPLDLVGIRGCTFGPQPGNVCEAGFTPTRNKAARPQTQGRSIAERF